MRKRTKLSDIYYIGLNYKRKTAVEIEKIIGVNKKTIHEIGRRYRLKKVINWTKDEVDILIKIGALEASKILNRSYNSCKIKKSRLCHMKKLQKT